MRLPIIHTCAVSTNDQGYFHVNMSTSTRTDIDAAYTSAKSHQRGNAADKLNGRNINVSFTNNSDDHIEVMVFVFYSDEIPIDSHTHTVRVLIIHTCAGSSNVR